MLLAEDVGVELWWWLGGEATSLLKNVTVTIECPKVSYIEFLS